MDDSKKSVLRQYHQELRTGVLVLNFLPTLHPLLTEVEYQLIVDKQGNVAMVDELIATLLTKENKHFDGFCTALRKHGYPQWANKLQNMPQGDVNTEPSPGDPSVNLEPTPTLSPVASEGATLKHRTRSAPPSVPVRKDPSTCTASSAFSLQRNEDLSVSQESITSASVKLSHTEVVAESDSSELTLEQIEDEILQLMDGITEESNLHDNYEVDDRVEQLRCEIQTMFIEHLSGEATAGVVEATEDKSLVFDELYSHVLAWKEKLQQVIVHRRTATAFFNWASEANKLEKNTAAARVAGYGTAIGGGVVFAIGSGLLLGGVTAPAGIILIAIGGGVGATGSITAIAGCVTKLKMAKDLKKKAQQWLKENQSLCKALMNAHDHLMERKAHVERYYPYVNVDEKLADIFNADIPQALEGVNEIVGNWRKALVYGPEEAVSLIAAAAGGSATIAQGVIDGVDAGTEVAAIAAKATAKLAGASVAVAFSAILIAVDIGLLAKASYDLHNSLKGKPTKLAKVMNELAAEVERETRVLEDNCRCFSDRQ